MRRSTWFLTMMAALAACGLTSCSGFGQVEQGLVIDYDAMGGRITVITDSNPADPRNPRYDVLPPKIVRIPTDPSQMGPSPTAGKLLHFDADAGELVVFDPDSAALRTISFSVIERADDVYPNDSRVAGASLPRIDRVRSAVTIYSPRQRQLTTISLPADALSLPEDCWLAGDEVRYYFRDPGQALRLMNVTRTTVS